MDKNIEQNLIEFITLFEEVFDKDWKYSKEMMGIHEQTDEQKRSAQEMGLESIDLIAETGTFLNPKVADETEDWGHRGALLEKYRELKKLIKSI